MVMYGMHPPVERQDPHTGNSLVGTDTSHNPKLVDHHGKVQAALSGINPHERTGHTPVVLVRAEHPLFAARRSFLAQGYRDLSQGIHDINI